MTDVCITREYNVKIHSEFYVRTCLRGESNEGKVSVDFRELDKYTSALDLDLAYIAAGLFACEGLSRNGYLKLDDSISILVQQHDTLRNENIETLIQDLISFTLRARPKVKILGVKARPKVPLKRIERKFGSSCLFSGGIDSLSGILNAHQKLGPTFGIFVSHDRMSSKVNYLNKQFLKERKIHIHEGVIQRGHAGLQQLRGFVYLVFGAIAAKVHNTDKVVISETGQTMFQPEITALDEVTLTTHPTLIRISKALLQQAYGRKFDFCEPFADLTKAEVISLCQAKEGIPQTNSCITTRFANQIVSHCGKCYGCLVRRISCIVAGVRDAEYAKDVLIKDVGEPVMGGWPGKTILVSDLSDLKTLLRFARDILEDRLDDVSRFKIEAFSKQEVYKRFAMDMMAALYLLYDKTNNGRNSWTQKFYTECKRDRIITSESADNRIAEVRERKFQPDFDYKL